MTSFRSIILLLIVGIAAGCQPGVLHTIYAPQDACFGGDYSDEFFSLHLTYDAGLVTFTVFKDATEQDPWEGMGFLGRVVETGRAEGTMSLIFPREVSTDSEDPNPLEFDNYSIRLSPPREGCTGRNQLVFDFEEYVHDGTHGFNHILTRR